MNTLTRLLVMVVVGACWTGSAFAEPESAVASDAAPSPAVTASTLEKFDQPPIPLSTDREKRILAAVFLRFPDVDPSDVMNYLRDHFPHEVRYFTQLSMRDVDRSVEYLTRVVADCAELLSAQQNDPRRHGKLLAYQKLELKAYDAAEAVRDADEASRDAKRAALLSILESSFEVKQELMHDELAVLEEELLKLRDMIEKRQRNKSAIINRRILQITGETEGLQW